VYDGETEPIPRVTDRTRHAKHDRDEPGNGSARHEPDVDLPVGHGHGHGPTEPASSRVRTIIAILLIPFALAAAVGVVLLYPFGDHPTTKSGAGTPVNGVVTAAEAGACNGDVQVGDQGGGGKCLVVRVRMTDGDAPDQEIRTVVPLEPSTPRFAVDDKVVLAYAGGNPADGASYQLVDFQRDVPLVLLAVLFAIAVLVLGRWQGLKALAALVISFVVLVFFVLPAILAGENPLMVAVVGAGVIMFVVLYLTHGLTARTSTAVLGTMVSLTLIGLLGVLWAGFANLTGIDEDTSTLIGLLNRPIDTRGLLLAGVVIGALGVLDDVTVTQTSAVWELRAANPSLTRRQLYAAALRIGRDHVASAMNTLVMAYAGAALPLLMYSSISGVGIGNILTSQSIAQEIVRTLVGSIGIVAAVPVTTLLATAVAAEERPAVEETVPRKKGDGERRAVDRDRVRGGEQGERERTASRERGGERAGERERKTTRERVGERDRGERSRADVRERTGERERGALREGERGGIRERSAEHDRLREPVDRERAVGRDRAAERSRRLREPADEGDGAAERPAARRPRPQRPTRQAD
jgi:uncharacterized membrane protein